MTTDKSTPKDISPVFNRWAYGGFVLLSLYFLFISNDVFTAASNLGIALIFDPFNQSTKWVDRKNWQKVWLVVHLLLMLALFVFGLLTKR